MTNKIIKSLGDGLILRRSTSEDTEKLAEFNAKIHSDEGPNKPDERLYHWVQDLMTRPHPTFQRGDFTIVEDTKSGDIISSLNIIPQTWLYGGVPFKVGRPELVGTHPDYRRRGLIRAQMEIVHQWSAERGEKMQAIAGIPWYYRQFGYEMALELGGGRIGYQPHVPKLKDEEHEPYHFRSANEQDIPFIMGVYQRNEKSQLISCLRDETQWRYEISGRHENNANRIQIKIIETPGGEPAGFFGHIPYLWGPTLTVVYAGLNPGHHWLKAAPNLMRYLQKTGKMYAEEGKSTKKDAEWEAFYLALGSDHPLYRAFHDGLARTRKPYAWYIRIPDLPGFLAHIAPALERRLADSELAGFSGKLAINFYRSGVRLVFEQGKITQSEIWEPSTEEEGSLTFPDRTFLTVLCGYRSFEQWEAMRPDCYAKNDEARLLVHVLFPKKPSNVWAVD